MPEVIDSVQRRSAIDTGGSYCVTAPAGSGKTELLIQRYLALMARVERPEQILAITFTRKAAAEMRERVLEALQEARDDVPCDSAHKVVTRELAVAALAADRQRDWRLLDNVSRMSIKTIDSFCAGLTRQMPILSSFGAQANPQDDAWIHYEEAVLELYGLLDSGHEVAGDLGALLLHFDNRWERVQSLLVEMLGRRDQWRDFMGVHHTAGESENYLVTVVEGIVQQSLEALTQDLAPYSAALVDLAQFRAENLGRAKPAGFPAAHPDGLPAWRELAAMLQTEKGQWRKAVDKRAGFPADKEERPQRMKSQMLALLEDLASIDGLEGRLHEVRSLPEMELGSEGWQLVLQLSRILPVLAAQLLLVFQRHQVVDHGQVAASALAALGEDDNPTELALRLDYRIEHILVDEFQDTAINQYELVQKLTRGWGEYNASNPGAPRTLMVVGDAMQSIYGFRSANVGLFFRAQEEGFNGVRLQPLALQCNFRSDANIIDWVNDAFSRVFPQANEVTSGRVRYSPATAVKPAGDVAEITLDAFRGDDAREAETEVICRRIATCVAGGENDIAVLGRQRSHLFPIARRLKEMGISYLAESLDSLAHSPVVADLLTLCRALANSADRLAWTALLRAPWCGLALADLHVVARYGEGFPHQSIAAVLGDDALDAALSADGARRLAHVRRAVSRALASRDRLDLRIWVEQCWLALGGAQCAPGELALEDAESFFQLLELASADGRGLDITWLERQVSQRFMSGGEVDCPVQIMTLHKAKGLEFGRVFIPRLDGRTRSDAGDLLLWDEYAGTNGERAFLLAANDHSKAGTPTLYQYLRARRKDKTAVEATRLLYVGATRAINQLHLSACLGWDERKDVPRAPAKDSLLQAIWPVFEQQMRVHDAGSAGGAQEQPLRRLHRLPTQDLPAPVSALAPEPPEDNLPERPDNHLERVVGTVIHLALEELSLLAELPGAAGDADFARWRVALQAEGLWGESLQRAEGLLAASLAATLAAGGEGRWVLSPGHEQARSEWALTCRDAKGRPADLVVDRSFVDAATGLRWIVDYKSSRPETDESWEAFTAREAAHYREQLQRYRDAVAARGNEPIRCALFFTGTGRLHVLDDLNT